MQTIRPHSDPTAKGPQKNPVFTTSPDSQHSDLNSLPIFTGLPKFGFVSQKPVLSHQFSVVSETSLGWDFKLPPRRWLPACPATTRFAVASAGGS